MDFIWGGPEVSLLQSGMITMEQLENNLVYVSRATVGMLSKQDKKILKKAKGIHDIS